MQTAVNTTSNKIHGFACAPSPFPLTAAFLWFWLPWNLAGPTGALRHGIEPRSQRGPGMTGKCLWIYWIIMEMGTLGRERGGGVGDSMGGRIPCAAGRTRGSNGRDRKRHCPGSGGSTQLPVFSFGFFPKEKLLTCSCTSLPSVFP